MMGLKLTMTCTAYDRNQALLNGTVKPDGIDLDTHIDPEGGQFRLTHARGRKFDIIEFHIGMYIADLPYKVLSYTAIPIFVKRMFRHSYIYINKRAGIKKPADLNGKRVGIQTWFTTTALWARGILAEEYGVDLKSITWVAQEAESIGEWQQPSWLRLEIAEGKSQYGLLASGVVDASITTGVWAPDKHPDITFLFPNYAEVEREYFKRTGFFPINHILIIKDSVLEEHSWVAMSMFNGWQESKNLCYKWLEWQRVHQTSMWFRALWEEERAAAGSDIYPWGFQAARKEIEKMLDYSVRQGIIPSCEFRPEQLFHHTTLNT
jgi:4,5-dihydroxyphthalate decarboxylase